VCAELEAARAGARTPEDANKVAESKPRSVAMSER
jgi:hypothetical protein